MTMTQRASRTERKKIFNERKPVANVLFAFHSHKMKPPPRKLVISDFTLQVLRAHVLLGGSVLKILPFKWNRVRRRFETDTSIWNTSARVGHTLARVFVIIGIVEYLIRFRAQLLSGGVDQLFNLLSCLLPLAQVTLALTAQVSIDRKSVV